MRTDFLTIEQKARRDARRNDERAPSPCPDCDDTGRVGSGRCWCVATWYAYFESFPLPLAQIEETK